MTLIISGLGYEGVVKVLIVKGTSTKNCLKKAYMNLHSIEDNYELEECLEDYKSYSEEDWIDELEYGFDSSDWCMTCCYDATNDKVLFNNEGELELIK